MTKQELIEIFESLEKEYPNDELRTIWEIFCYQNNIDEECEGFEAEVFDEWAGIE